VIASALPLNSYCAMSIYEVNSSDPLQQFADRIDRLKDVSEVVRTVVLTGYKDERYKLELVKRYQEAGLTPSHYYTVIVYVEDFLEVNRAVSDDSVVTGVTQFWTRWTSFPKIKENEADAALAKALEHLINRIK